MNIYQKEVVLLRCVRSIFNVGRSLENSEFARGLIVGRGIEMGLLRWQELNIENIIKARCAGVSA